MNTEIVVIIDKSGSMSSLTNDTIGGYNGFLEEQIKNEIQANVNVLFFNTKKTWFQTNTPIKEAKRLDRDNYKAEGGTALNDAVARAYYFLEHKNPEKAIVVIITDGVENASEEIKPNVIKGMLSKLQQKEYRIVYLAANQDAFATGNSLGIDSQCVANISGSGVGIRSAYAAASNATLSYASGGTKGIEMATQTFVDNFVK